VSDWREFDQNPVSHSAAHHLVAISELTEEFGYARVSDVARTLNITRGSVSVTLKGLKGRGLVTEDDRRFVGLSEEGARIVRTVQAKRQVMKTLMVELLNVPEEVAERDTCKIEHLISDVTAELAGRVVLALRSGEPEVEPFLGVLRRVGGDHISEELEFPSKDLAQLIDGTKAAEKKISEGESK